MKEDNNMPKTKYIYSVYDLQKKTYIAFFSSLNKAREFALAHDLKMYDNGWNPITCYAYTNKQTAYSIYSPENIYSNRGNSTHIYVQIPLDKNGKLDI